MLERRNEAAGTRLRRARVWRALPAMLALLAVAAPASSARLRGVGGHDAGRAQHALADAAVARERTVASVSLPVPASGGLTILARVFVVKSLHSKRGLPRTLTLSVPRGRRPPRGVVMVARAWLAKPLVHGHPAYSVVVEALRPAKGAHASGGGLTGEEEFKLWVHFAGGQDEQHEPNGDTFEYFRGIGGTYKVPTSHLTILNFLPPPAPQCAHLDVTPEGEVVPIAGDSAPPTDEVLSTLSSSQLARDGALAACRPPAPAPFYGRMGLPVPPQAPTGTGYDGMLESLSCPTTSLCVAGDAAGDILTSTDPAGGAGSWNTAHVDASNGIWGLSCESSTLCVAADSDGNILTSSNPAGGASAWSARAADAGTHIYAVSCVPGLCAAGDDSGAILTSTNPTGGTWTTTHVGGATHAGHSTDGVACASSALCVADDAAGNVLTAQMPTGGAPAWSASDIDGSSFMWPVACVAGGVLCLVGDANGAAFASSNPTGGEWQASRVSPHAVYALSCPSTALCVAGDASGGVATSSDPSHGGAWTLVQADPGRRIFAVSCPSVAFCAAVDDSGNVLTSQAPTAGTWSAAHINSAPAFVPPIYRPPG
jgi:hypothetical protein